MAECYRFGYRTTPLRVLALEKGCVGLMKAHAAERHASRRSGRKLALALMVPLLVGPWAGCSPKPAADDDATTMKAGLDALSARHDPGVAVAAFRKVLEHNPNHYGATFQLAAALEAAGRPDEARPLWEKMLQMAEASKDIETADKARARLHSTP